MTIRSRHGGRRQGAGRKPLGPAPLERVTVGLPPDLAAWVRGRPEGASAFMRACVERRARDTWWFPDGTNPFTPETGPPPPATPR